jgi:hypothetical protein
MASVAEIAAAINLRRDGRGWRGGCLICGGTRKFTLKEGMDGTPLVWCHGGCEQGKILAELRRRGLLPGREDHEQREVEISTPAPKKAAPPPLDWSPRCDFIWSHTEEIAGTPVDAYLAMRIRTQARPNDIRYLAPGILGPFPIMVARVTDIITAAPISLHFTRLKLDGSGKAPVEKPKLLMTRHRKSGGCIRLVPDADVTTGLGLTEGIETGLAVMAAGWSPVWAAIDAGNMAAFPVLNGIESMTIFADHDTAGLRDADACRRQWRDAGRECRIVNPRTLGADWADEVAA